jgi:hypothetical protein
MSKLRLRRAPKMGATIILLPKSLQETWEDCLRSAGIQTTMGAASHLLEPDHPPGLGSREGSATLSDMCLTIQGAWSPWLNCYTLTLVFRSVKRNLALARKIHNVLVERGTVPLRDDLGYIEDCLAGRPRRKLEFTSRRPG